MRYPLISVIMPTMDARMESEHTDDAIKAFARQTWPNKELVIIAESPLYLDVYGELLDYCDIKQAKVIHARGTTGVKRNIACQIASGEIIAHMDDDDFSASSRLSSQVNILMNCGKQATGFHSMHFMDEPTVRWFRYSGHITDTLGASLMYWRGWWRGHPFPDKALGEDADFINEAIRAQELYATDGTGLMYATCHAGNTSPRPVRLMSGNNSSWQEVSKPEAFRWR